MYRVGVLPNTGATTPAGDYNDAYWQAWRQNPRYILEVILYRWRSILSFYDPFFVLQNGLAYNAKLQAAVIWPGFFLPLIDLISRYGLLILLLAVIVYRRQPSVLAILVLCHDTICSW